MEDEREAFQNYLRELKVEHLTSIDDMKELSAHADTYLEVKIALIKQLELEAFQKSLKMMDMKAKLQTRIKEKAKALERKPKAVNPSFRAYLLNRFFAWESNENPQYTADTFVPPAHLEKTLGEGCHFLLRLKNARGSSQRYVISFDKAFAEVTGLWLAGEEDDLTIEKASHADIETLLSHLKAFVGDIYYGGKTILIDLIDKFVNKKEPLNISNFFLNL